jgi:hypothetical protein
MHTHCDAVIIGSGIPKTKGWANYRNMKPQAVSAGLYLTGDSVFPGQSTLATASGGTRLAHYIMGDYNRKMSV